jgi:hypothetical protein
LGKYKRIEVHAYRRRVTVVSGAWRPEELFESPPAHAEDEVSLNDSDVDEPVEPDLPEGQLILVEAVRSLERRLSPETRAMLVTRPNTPLTAGSKLNRFLLRLQSLCQFIRPNALRLARKEK